MDILFTFALLLAGLGWGAACWGSTPTWDGEELFLALCLGLAFISQFVLVLGTISLLSPPLLLSLLYLGALAGAIRLARCRRPAPAVQGLPPYSKPWLLLFVLLVGVTLWRAAQGDLGADPYHAFLPKAFLLQGSLAPFPGVLESTYFMNLELLNVVAFAHGTGAQPALLSAALYGLAAWGVLLILGRVVSTKAAAFGALIVLTSPPIARAAATSHVENGQALFLVASVLAGLRWRREGGLGSALRAAFLLSFLVGTKETAAFLLLPCALVLVLGTEAGVLRRPVPRAGRWAAAALVVGLPLFWVARKWQATGNPLYPFLIDLLSTSQVFRPAAEHFARIHPVSALAEPWKALRSGTELLVFDGIGELPLALLSGLLLLRSGLSRRRVPLVLGGLLAGIACLFGAAGQARFAGPLVPLLAVASAVVFDEVLGALPEGREAVGRAVATVLSGLLLVRYPLHVWPMYSSGHELFRWPPLTLAERLERTAEADPTLLVLPRVNRARTVGELLLVVSRPRHLEFLDVPFLPPSHFVRDPRSLYRGMVGWGGSPRPSGVLIWDADASEVRDPAETVLIEQVGVRLIAWPRPAATNG